jgi:hypothetical protein
LTWRSIRFSSRLTLEPALAEGLEATAPPRAARRSRALPAP